MLLSWCGPGGPGLPMGLFLVGLAGGPLHCGPMCGPFVLGQTADRLAALPSSRLCEMARLRAGLLAPYHIGRLITYTGLGATAGMLGSLPASGHLAGVLLLGGALLFLSQALTRLVPSLPHFLAPARPPSGWIAGLGRLTRRLDRTTWAGSLALGLALGFLPCGLLYAAVATAASATSPGASALAMLAFGAGTVPMLAAIGLAGQAAGRRWQGLANRVAPFVMLANAALLATAAMNMILSR